MALTIMAATGVLGVVKLDGRVGCVVLWWASALYIIFSDARHSTDRKKIAAGIAFGVIALLMVIPSFYFGTFPDLNVRNVNPSLSNDVGIYFLQQRAVHRRQNATDLLFLFWQEPVHSREETRLSRQLEIASHWRKGDYWGATEEVG